jgi:hypothetical protein
LSSSWSVTVAPARKGPFCATPATWWALPASEEPELDTPEEPDEPELDAPEPDEPDELEAPAVPDEPAVPEVFDAPDEQASKNARAAIAGGIVRYWSRPSIIVSPNRAAAPFTIALETKRVSPALCEAG